MDVFGWSLCYWCECRGRAVVEFITHDDVVETRVLVDISATATVSDALKLLARHRVLAAPVRLAERDGIDYCGFVDVLDLLTYLLKYLLLLLLLPSNMS